jgi:hypothetical protein
MSDIFSKMPVPATKEEFRSVVELWEHKGHKNVVAVDFDDDTGEMVLTVQDYVMPDTSYFIRVKSDDFETGGEHDY